eukprot:7251220-Pyramimonas_sp.AAC.1
MGSDSKQSVHAAVEHAAASMGRRPRQWPGTSKTQHQLQQIHAKCHYYPGGATLDDYAELEEEDDGEGGKHVELHSDRAGHF